MKPHTVALLAALGLLVVLHSTAATEVDLCEDSSSTESAEEKDGDDEDTGKIQISGCNKPPCRLRRKSTTHVEFKFTPKEDTKSLKTEVYGKILGIPFPFLGVDNTNACNDIFLADGKTKVPCPLKAGEEYVYKNKFDILELYPKVKVDVHWALVSEKKQRPVCFDVPAKITS